MLFFESDEFKSEFAAKFKPILDLCKNDMRQELDFDIYKILRNQILHTTLYRDLRTRKFKVPISNSRYMIGIIDESGTLREDEIHVAYKDKGEKSS